MAAKPAVQCARRFFFHSYLNETKKINIQFVNNFFIQFIPFAWKFHKTVCFLKHLHINCHFAVYVPFTEPKRETSFILWSFYIIPYIPLKVILQLNNLIYYTSHEFPM